MTSFSMSSCYNSWITSSNPEFRVATVWRSIPPLRHGQLALRSHPHHSKSQRRSRPSDSDHKTGSHLLLHCNISRVLWSFMYESYKIAWCMLEAMHQVLQDWPKVKLPAKGRKLWLTIPHAVVWTLWKPRNYAISRGKRWFLFKAAVLLEQRSRMGQREKDSGGGSSSDGGKRLVMVVEATCDDFGTKYFRGESVEMSSKEDGFVGSYYEATIVEPVQGMNKVDVFANDGWWTGRITGRNLSNYYVYFDRSTGETIGYRFSELRVHQE